MKKAVSIVLSAFLMLGVVNVYAVERKQSLEDYNEEMTDILRGNSEGHNIGIGVMAEVAANGPAYKIDVEWGSMQFKFNTSNTAWNPITHTYNKGGEEEDATWIVVGGNGTGNKITVTNHSAFAIGMTFDYKEDNTEVTLNSNEDDANKVVGMFRLDESDLQMQTLINTADVPFAKGGLVPSGNPQNTYYGAADESMTIGEPEAVFFLPTADGYKKSDATKYYENGERKCDFYFGFAGTPDNTAFGNTKVGDIFIDFYPFKEDGRLNNVGGDSDRTKSGVFPVLDEQTGKWE